eukprot:TRINITY_DN584_c0_g1_i1.p1 TRINITY_DN584_c0_g1~~TRINITY_DN584_c0_g1_i1.p1  ORF type:complete len:304 (-),score=98.81 TRINITY_DN584_c0_g1_i1:95-1006(-)
MSFNTQHTDMIHDAQMDYYGKRIATCSSDKTIKIFDVTEDSQNLSAELKGHDGPVWQVSWANPTFGNYLCSCSFDRKVIVWEETSANNWQITYELSHDRSVNSVAWAPVEYGLKLAAGSSDGNISIISYNTESSNWTVEKIQAHKIGVTSVSWQPVGSSLLNREEAPIRLASGGCDNLIMIWKYVDNNWEQDIEPGLMKHNEWVRDVAFAPNIGVPYNTLATCSQDGSVFIWTNQKSEWSYKELPLNSNDVVWKVSWSTTGNILAVSQGDNSISLWKENLNDGEWVNISEMDDNGNLSYKVNE